MPVFREDPYGAFSFQVEFLEVGIDGTTVVGGFTEVRGLNAEVQTIEYRNGNERTLTPRRLPGLVSYPDLVLRRGVIGDLTLWNWLAQSLSGQPQRASGHIHLFNEAHDQIVTTWKVRDAWPTKYTGPDLNAKVSEIAVEELVLTHGGIEIED